MTLVEQMIEWRHDFHRSPELAFEVHQTAEKVATLLRSFGLDEVHAGIGRTGVIGIVRAGSSARSIGLRADLDALPIHEQGDVPYRSAIDGAFHGCGHDGHTAALLGVAKQLSERRDFDGTVYLIFQPNEENGLGAQAMIDDGLFDRFPMAAIYGLHNKPGIPAGHFATRVGPMMSSEDLFEITITGRGGHASMPERLIDPVVIAAEVVQALQTIVSRSVGATEVAVVSITEMTTDGARNIVPTTVMLRGDCRTFSADVQATIERRMREIATGICAAHGASAAVRYWNEFVPLINTAREVDVAVAAAARVAGTEHVNADCPLVTASEDFARYLQFIPGCFMDIGNGTEGHCGSSLHNPRYDFNDDILGPAMHFFLEVVREELRLR